MKQRICNHNHYDKCHDPCDGYFVVKNCRIPFFSTKCCNPFNLRLAELNQNLNFQLYGMKGCLVVLQYECSGASEEVTGVVCNIGTDYIEVLRDNGVVTTILKEKICKIDWKDPCCNPCSSHH